MRQSHVTATLKPGETVLDLGSGGGIDIFLAASKIGPNGKAIGLDMSAEMIKRARQNAMKRGLFPPHVAFVECSLTEPLPIASNSVDCVLSMDPTAWSISFLPREESHLP
ncbi:S-adenosyl-L-methionine-dependent methyltransferase [Mycena filopes]|nr:S-adenosyl-L-methionine-dependent methyltransferase [Mycena filopes]